MQVDRASLWSLMLWWARLGPETDTERGDRQRKGRQRERWIDRERARDTERQRERGHRDR